MGSFPCCEGTRNRVTSCHVRVHSSCGHVDVLHTGGFVTLDEALGLETNSLCNLSAKGAHENLGSKLRATAAVSDGDV
jgi:hypothetical protein